MKNPPEQQHHHETADKDRVSMREKIGLGFGKSVADGTHGSLYTLINPIYNITMGLDPKAISTIMFIQRLWDAILDPLLGQFSDNFRSRWGRRRPLLFLSVFPLALLFGVMWWFPQAVSTNYLFWHLMLVSMVFYAAHSLYAMPLGGLIIEATDDYHERTRIAGITLAFGFAMQIGSQWLFPLTQTFVPAHASAAEKVTGTLHGLRWVTGGCVIFFLLAGMMPILLCRERLYAKVTRKQERTSLLQGLRTVRDNRSFMSLLLARSVFSFGYNLVGALGGYMYIYYVYGGDVKGSAINAAWLGSSFHVAAILTSLVIFPWLQHRVGKRRCLQIAACVLIVDCLSKIILYQHGQPWWPLFVIVTNGVANAGISLMAIAMVGDLADYDEIKTGLRREALYTSLLSWFEKAGGSLGVFFTGFLLSGIGFNAKFGAQHPHTLELMKFSYVVAPLLGAILTLILIRGYDLSQDQVYEIKEELTRRRALKAASTEPAE
jgi:GPH family glycoside/pentoside/hexuronide:cation symporter